MRLAISIGHEASVTYETLGGEVKVLEFERYFKIKKFSNLFKPLSIDSLSPHILSEEESKRSLTEDFGGSEEFYNNSKELLKLFPDKDLYTDIVVSCCLDNSIFERVSNDLSKIFKNAKFTSINHRLSHAWSVFGGIPEKEAISIILDGSGNGCFTVIKHCCNSDTILDNSDFNFGLFYEYTARKILKDFNANCEGPEGVFMGLASYGTICPNLKERLVKLFTDSKLRSIQKLEILDEIYLEVTGGLTFSDASEKNILVNPKAIPLKKFARTFQASWVESVLTVIKCFSDKNTPACLSGGCFLNCELNREIIKGNYFKKVYFSPVPSDCGQSLGGFLYQNKKNINTPYLGFNVFDWSTPHSMYEGVTRKELNLDELANFLEMGLIVAVIRGNSEIGPRALGNRSILASPLKQNMKRKLNTRVKHRQWFRPYGAIIQREFLQEYFDLDLDLPYMNILAYNKTNLFPEIRHIDNSTRVQTIDKDNDFLYKLLDKFKDITGHPILINTSLNIRGKPIINWSVDAFEMLRKKEIDVLVLEDYVYSI